MSLPEIDVVTEAMEWEGMANLSEFARAAIKQRAARILRQKKRELASEEGNAVAD